MTVEILQGDCCDILPTLPRGSVDCCVTSPPYFGLRDYDVPPTGWPEISFSPMPGLAEIIAPAGACCHGSEEDIISFVAHEVFIFREVRKVLKDTGILWLNFGDSYSTRSNGAAGKTSQAHAKWRKQHRLRSKGVPLTKGIKHKDMLGIPWRVAFALQADGWYLRQDIIWSKPNPMPESVRDRCTKAHEYIFLLSKSPQYFYDHEAIKEPVSGTAHRRCKKGTGVGFGHGTDKEERTRSRVNKKTIKKSKPPGVGPKAAAAGSGIKANESFLAAMVDLVDKRNKRSVWTVPTQSYHGAHFATFPEKLIEPCVLAGCPEGGIVLDPFGGSGTTGRVALKHRRKAILIELKSEYIELQRKRTSSVQVNLF